MHIMYSGTSNPQKKKKKKERQQKFKLLVSMDVSPSPLAILIHKEFKFREPIINLMYVANLQDEI